jgi:hypothetical protein
MESGTNKMELVENIKYNDQVYAIIIRNQFNKEGIHFFTPSEFSQQLGYMHHPPGKKIEPHFHNAVERNVVYTQEVLFIKKGKLKVNFYDDDRKFIGERILSTGDVILLSNGGHGFEVLEELEMIEVKQGPYCGDLDKTRFLPS